VAAARRRLGARAPFCANVALATDRHQRESKLMLQRHALADRGNDLYETPAVAVEALLRVEKLPHHIWEPAAGRGAIVNVLRVAGHAVLASDLVDYGDPTHFSRRDFLLEHKLPDRVEAIVTNPPYKLAEEFVAHALDLDCPLVIMLLRHAFWESERRTDILERRGLARVHVFRRRLPRMHRDGWTGPRATSSIPFAWFVWNRSHTGPTTIDRLSWNPPRAVPLSSEFANTVVTNHHQE
jgi:hypothetical protein